MLTTHGRGGFSRLWLGSVTGDLLRVSPVPLLVVHAREDTEPSPPVDPTHVLLPVDGDGPDAATLDAALALVRPFAARVTVLRVVRTADSLLPYDRTFWAAPERAAADRRQAAAERDVAAVVERVRGVGVEAAGSSCSSRIRRARSCAGRPAWGPLIGCEPRARTRRAALAYDRQGLLGAPVPCRGPSG